MYNGPSEKEEYKKGTYIVFEVVLGKKKVSNLCDYQSGKLSKCYMEKQTNSWLQWDFWKQVIGLN